MLQEGQQAPQKEILIPFRQALQAWDIGQINAHLKISVDKFQGGYIKLYLHKWIEWTSDKALLSREKSNSGYRFILNSKKLNESV